MARVEITQSVGPEVITSIDESALPANTADKYSTAVDVSRYTLHSYHVISDKNCDFTIAGSNVTAPATIADWVTISTHAVVANTPLAYSDTWNFKYSRVLITTGNVGNAVVKVHEKHNA